MYLKCVTIKEVDCNNNKLFKYSIKENGQIIEGIYDIVNMDRYNSDSDIRDHLDELYQNYPLIRNDSWNDYKGALLRIQECKKENPNYQEEDCYDDDIRRKMYYYLKPEDYLLYKDQRQVIEYLIQNEYHGFTPTIEAPPVEEGSFLKTKFIIISLILLFL